MEFNFNNKKIEVKNNGKIFDQNKRDFIFLTWNIGYAGLGKEMDFFYDGGKKVRPSKEQYNNYLNGINEILKDNNTVDFISLQEVDICSKRSWYMDEFSSISKTLSDFYGLFVLNYKCEFVPLPIKNPMGKVISGLINFSKGEPHGIEIHYFKTSFWWPKRLFFPKRCYVLSRFNLNNGKSLVIFNTHNSAYDEGEKLRQKELVELGSKMEEEFSKGNYVVASGDWNMNPRNFNKSKILSGDNVVDCNSYIPSNFLPNWNFVFDEKEPSNRNVDISYEKGKTKTTILDFFITSPNIETGCVKIIKTDFKYSDHQPILMSIKLK